MIAIDTNVLLRYLLDDDKTQSAKAQDLIRDRDPVLVTDVVLVETVWVLEGKKYALSKNRVVDTINQLLTDSNLEFENAQVIFNSLNQYRKTAKIKVGKKKKDADFSDALIVEKAKWHCDLVDTFDGLYTFDKAALQIAGTKEPS